MKQFLQLIRPFREMRKMAFFSFVLFALIAIPMGMRGQTRTIQTAFYGFESGDAGWTATAFVTNNTAITAYSGSKYGATNGGSTASIQFNTKVTNPQSLTCYYSKTTNNTNASSHFVIQVSSDNSTWTTVATGSGMNDVTKGTWYELTADLTSYSDVYVRVKYDGTSAVRALDDITLTYDDGTTPSIDPEISFSPTSITLDESLVGNEVTVSFSVSQANLTSGISLSVDNGSLSTSSIAQGASATNVTWTYTPSAAGAISATVTATSGTTTETLDISGTAIAPVESYDVNFEYDAPLYPNWTFDNMTTLQTGSITAHGGTYYGTTGGKATASITTESKVENPGTLTCYVSKQSGNTTSSTWYIQVSEDGTNWTNVQTQSATSMSQGSWVECSADLSNYSDVYVRVYYDGSTAVRNIDDLTLTIIEPSSAVATTTTINVPQNFNTDIYQGTNAGTLTATVSDNDDNVISGASVTWESSNTDVATIDNNGAVTLVAVGTTTFTASYAGESGVYNSSSATYELTVTSSEPYEQPTTIEITPNYEFWGKTGQFSGNTYNELEGSQDNVSLLWTRGNGSTYANSTAMRFYKDNELTFTAPDGYEIKSIDITFTTPQSDLSFSPDGYSLSGTTGTWTGSSETVTMSRPSNASNYAQISKFTITIGLPSTTPSITANNIEIAYDATNGLIEYAISNPVQAATLSAISNAEWLTVGTVGNTSIPFTCSANQETVERTATVTLSYVEGEETLATKEVTITQAAAPVIYTTIPSLFEAATSTETSVLVSFNNWVVSGVSTNGKNVFVTDNTGNGFVIYNTEDMSGTYAVGSILSCTAVSCSLKKYTGFAELLNVNANDLTIATGGNVTEANVAMADLSGVNTGALLHYEGLTCSVENNKYNLSDGTTSIQVYNAIFAFGALEADKTYNITGIYQQYNNTKEILPRSAADIEEVVPTVPVITVAPATVDAPAEGAEGTLTISYENIPDLISFDIQFCDANGDELAGDDPDWVYAGIEEDGDNYTIDYIIDANDGAARTAYFKVYTFVGAEEVYSNLVIFNQAKYQRDYATLPFEWEGGASADFLDLNGVTANGLGSDYASNNSPYLIKLDGDGDYIQVKCDQQPGKVTIGVKMIGGASTSTITVQGSADGETFTDIEELTISGAQNDTLCSSPRVPMWVSVLFQLLCQLLILLSRSILPRLMFLLKVPMALSR